jgi:MFS family permease
MQVADGMCTQALVTLTQGPILASFALLLRASDAAIGLLSGVGPLANVLQAPAIFVVERLGRRKRLVVSSLVAGRLLWVLVAALPWLVPEPWRLGVFVAALTGHFALAAFAACAWNSWMHDLVPPARLTPFFARRMSLSMWVGAGLSLAAGVLVDAWLRAGRDAFGAFAVLFVGGSLAGLLGCVFLGLTPEPAMKARPLGRLRDLLSEPLRDPSFRRVLVFTGAWTFAASLAAPFFPVYLVRRLDQGMAWVLGLSVSSQVAFAASLRGWGRFATRHGNKASLAVAVPLFLGTVLLWPATSLTPPGPLLQALLVAIHVAAGVAMAGVTLCGGNLVMGEAPAGRATPYLAANALVAGVAAAAAPLLAGIGSDVARGAGWTVAVGSRSLHGLDLVFLVAVLLGLDALRRLARVRETAAPARPSDLRAAWAEALRGVWQTTTVGGLRRLSSFPYARLRALLARRGSPRR